jgi:hypothetical protein
MLGKLEPEATKEYAPLGKSFSLMDTTPHILFATLETSFLTFLLLSGLSAIPMGEATPSRAGAIGKVHHAAQQRFILQLLR